MAALGQARFDGQITPEDESTVLAKLLTYWALQMTLDTSSYCALEGNRRVQPGSSTVAVVL
jgi:hypothetical protein